MSPATLWRGAAEAGNKGVICVFSHQIRTASQSCRLFDNLMCFYFLLLLTALGDKAYINHTLTRVGFWLSLGVVQFGQIAFQLSDPFHIILSRVKPTKPKCTPIRPWQPPLVGGTVGSLEENQQKWIAQAHHCDLWTHRGTDSVAAFMRYVSVKQQPGQSASQL